MGNYAKGEAELELLLQRNPDEAGPNNDLGYLYAEQGKNLEKAESMIRKALQEDPENYAYLDSMGWVLFKQGKVKEALATLKKAAERMKVKMEQIGRVRTRPSSSTWATSTSSSRRSKRPRIPGGRPSRPPRTPSRPTSGWARSRRSSTPSESSARSPSPHRANPPDRDRYQSSERRVLDLESARSGLVRRTSVTERSRPVSRTGLARPSRPAVAEPIAPISTNRCSTTNDHDQ